MSTDVSKEENFAEAVKAALKAWTPPRIPDDVQSILKDDKAVNPKEKAEEFWILAAALNEFVNNEGKGELPLAGAIPGIFYYLIFVKRTPRRLNLTIFIYGF